MKKIISILLICSLLLISGCKTKNTDTLFPASRDIEQSEFCSAMDFAALLLKNSYEKESVTVSPLSALTALGMISNGANGNTLSQIENATGFKIKDLNNMILTLSRSFSKSSELVSLNSLWVNKGISVENDFKSALTGYYNAEVFEKEFNDGTKEEINNWIKDSTDGIITDLANNISGDELTYLINALIFDAKWRIPFQINNVSEETFTREDRSTFTASMMRGYEHRYIEDENAIGFKKSYYSSDSKSENYDFIAILPDKHLSIKNYLASLTGEKLQKLIDSETERDILLTMPKFTAKTNINFISVLSKMGITDAFDSNKADFSKLSKEPSYIDKCYQKSVLSIDEQGTKAASSSIISSAQGKYPDEIIEINLNRPFVYMIVDKQTSFPVYMGAYMGDSEIVVSTFTCGEHESIDKPQLNNSANEIMGWCGNTQASVTKNGKTTTFMGSEAISLTEILMSLDYKPENVCKCHGDVIIDTEIKMGYEVSFGRQPWARCNEGQVDLTIEQANKINDLIISAFIRNEEISVP